MLHEGGHDMVTTALAQLELSALAQLLFASPVQPSELSSPTAIRTAVEVQFRTYHGNVAAGLALVAQEAGDPPDCYPAPLRWPTPPLDIPYFYPFPPHSPPP